MQRVGRSEPSFWFPPQSSTVAPRVDWLFEFLIWVSVISLVVITGLIIWLVIRYRHREGQEQKPAPSHSLALELTWSGVPLLVVAVVFAVGLRDYLFMRTAPKGAYEINVTAVKWSWSFTYPNGYTSGVLHAPKGIPVKLIMTSEDVIHSLYVPAFRVKMDVLPGRYTDTWFEATQVGDFDLYCTEYCGTKHSSMVTRVVVHEPHEFDKWLAEAANFLDKMPPAEAGRLLFSSRGCTQCHLPSQKAGIGPGLANIYGQKRKFRDGSDGVVDENYLRESILYPSNKIVAGFDPVMPTYQGRLKEKEVAALVEYLKGLRL